MTHLRNLITHHPLRLLAPIAAISALALTAACGGGGDSALDELTADPGRISCEAFNVMKGYKYSSTVTLDLKERPPEIAEGGGDQYRAEEFKHTQVMTGEVEPPATMKVHVSQPVQEQEADYVFVDGRVYFAFQGEPWDSKTEAEAGIQVPYPPVQMCNALGPDLFLDQLEGTPDTVNGVKATKYHVENFTSDWPDRHVSFTPSSDVSKYINTFTGDIWIAEKGQFIVKVDLSGTGEYENGRGIEVIYSYELSDVDKSIDVKAPA